MVWRKHSGHLGTGLWSAAEVLHDPAKSVEWGWPVVIAVASANPDCRGKGTIAVNDLPNANRHISAF